MTDMTLRAARAADIPDLQAIVAQTDLFPPELLPTLLRPALAAAPTPDTPPDLWRVVEGAGQVTGLCWAVPEPLTEGTWNMRALAVHPDHQGRGQGRAVVRAVESALRAAGHRLLIVDTSGTEAFAGTRRFYCALGYAQVACLPDFWAPGDDKVTFLKAL